MKTHFLKLVGSALLFVSLQTHAAESSNRWFIDLFFTGKPKASESLVRACLEDPQVESYLSKITDYPCFNRDPNIDTTGGCWAFKAPSAHRARYDRVSKVATLGVQCMIIEQYELRKLEAMNTSSTDWKVLTSNPDFKLLNHGLNRAKLQRLEKLLHKDEARVSLQTAVHHAEDSSKLASAHDADGSMQLVAPADATRFVKTKTVSGKF